MQPFTGTTGQGQAAMLVIAVVDPKHDLDGLTAGEAAARIDKALKDIYLEPLYVLRGKYNPPNYWGSVDSAIAWLKLIYDYCREHPDYIVRERS